MKRKLETFRGPSGGGGGVNCKKNGCGCQNKDGDRWFPNNRTPSKESGVYQEPTPITRSYVDSQDFIRRYPKYTPEAKMKGVDTSCSLKPISVIETRDSRRVRGESSYVLCAICDDAKPRGEMKRGSHCRHRYCENCIKEYLFGKVKENIHKIKCPETDCKKNLDIEFCQESIDSKELLEAWIDAERETKILANPSPIKCPFQDCSRTFVDDGKGFLIRACPNCWRIFCMRCKVKWHMGMSCWQYKFAIQIKNLFLKYGEDEEDDERIGWIIYI